MSEVTDVVVIGAGPCGLAAGASLKKAGLSAILVDKGCITNSIVDYPSYMTFFSTAANLELEDIPFVVPDGKPTRREALVYYRRVADHFGLDIRQYEEVTEVSGEMGAFEVRARARSDGETRSYQAHSIIMATGGFHQPNFLGVPGEELAKVHHYYREPYPFHGQDVVVVGGGNSAVESALDLFRNGARVTLVHFEDKLDRGVKPWVIPDITNRLDKGEIPVHWRSRIAEIKPRSVVLRHEDSGESVEIPNDWVIAMTGWRADPVLLTSVGVHVDADTGIPHHDPATMETNVPGVYIAGVLAAGHNANKIFIENGKWHGGLIARAIEAVL
jgi:thioredoxin reductase (NADPH)